MRARLSGIIGLLVAALVAATVWYVQHKRSASQAVAQREAAEVTAAANRVNSVHADRPVQQVAGKTLIMAVVVKKTIPAAETWCDDLNVNGSIWPTTPATTVFAMNSKVAGLNIMGGVNGNTVLFFETGTPGWNKAGGPELLPISNTPIAVALGDGRTLMVTPSQAEKLRWEP